MALFVSTIREPPAKDVRMRGYETGWNIGTFKICIANIKETVHVHESHRVSMENDGTATCVVHVVTMDFLMSFSSQNVTKSIRGKNDGGRQDTKVLMIFFFITLYIYIYNKITRSKRNVQLFFMHNIISVSWEKNLHTLVVCVHLRGRGHA